LSDNFGTPPNFGEPGRLLSRLLSVGSFCGELFFIVLRLYYNIYSMKKISEIINPAIKPDDEKVTKKKDAKVVAKEEKNDTIMDRHKYVTREFQDYGYRIALKLGELKNVSLYIKLAKDKPRVFLEQAFSFAIDYPNAKNKGRIFMWKLKELEKEGKQLKVKG